MGCSSLGVLGMKKNILVMDVVVAIIAMGPSPSQVCIFDLNVTSPILASKEHFGRLIAALKLKASSQGHGVISTSRLPDIRSSDVVQRFVDVAESESAETIV